MSESEGRRVRAALILAARTPEEIAPELNVSARTLGRVIAGERQLRDWERTRLAEILDVPLWFLVDGFAGAERPVERDRLAELELLVTAIDRKLDQADVGGKLAGLLEEMRDLRLAVDRSEA